LRSPTAGEGQLAVTKNVHVAGQTLNIFESMRL
jgi:hypothetical protein